MIYPFMTLDDGTEIVHSEFLKDGSVKVHIETPDEKFCFKQATCYLPSYRWEDVYGYSSEEKLKLEEVIKSTAHLIMQFSKEGCFENALSF